MTENWRTILSHKQDIHSIIFHLLVLVCYASAFTIYLNADSVGLSSSSDLFAFVIASALMLGWISGIDTGVNFHNHIHREVFKSKSLNLWFGRFWSLVSGWPAIYWKHAHITVHHKCLLTSDDWTLPKTKKNGELENLFLYSLLHWPWRYLPCIHRDYKQGRIYFATKSQFIKETIIFLLLWSIPFLIDPVMALGLWLLPQVIANVAVMGPGMYAQHYGCSCADNEHPYSHSNTFTSTFFNMTMFNIGYHIEHHQWSNEHWSTLPIIHQLHKPDFIKFQAHIVPFGYYKGGHLLSSWRGITQAKQTFMRQHPDYISSAYDADVFRSDKQLSPQIQVQATD